MQKPRNIIFAVSLVALFASNYAHAQLSSVPDPVEYSVSPETPGPNEKVAISAQGVGGFLGDAAITWTQNGKVVLSGVGENNFSFVTGALGSKTSVQVRIVSPSEGTITHDFTISPSLVNLVWEADTSAPPLYRGKSLYSAGSNLKVVAFPTVFINGAGVSPSVLSYQWSRADQPVTSQSGLGRSSFSFAGDQLQNNEDVSVDIYYGPSKLAHGEVVIPAVSPALYFYVKDPLRGTLYDAALPSGISLSSQELTIEATPFFFANSSLKSGAAVYNWQLNGEDSTGPDSAKGILTLRQAGAGQGSGVISVTLQNNDSDKFVQTAKAVLQIVFGQSSSGSLFGL